MNTSTLSFERHRAKRLCVYSHKGGVGKTTLTMNIAFALAERKQTVLLIDSDPQCNISAYLLGGQQLDTLLDASETDRGTTIWSTVRSVAKEKPPILIDAVAKQNILLLPGDIRLSEFEELLHDDWHRSQLRDLGGFTGTTAVSLVTNSISTAHAVDFVFYDCGPNIGPLNRVILLDCDYFIVPAACDEFSIRAVRTLGYTLKRWISQWSDIADLAPDGTYLLPGKPRFLGYIPQQYRVYGGQITEAFSQFLARIDRQVQEDIVSPLSELDPTLIPRGLKNYELGNVQNLSALVSVGQMQGRPVWAVDAGTSALREAAHSSFLSLADRIIENTERGSRANA